MTSILVSAMSPPSISAQSLDCSKNSSPLSTDDITQLYSLIQNRTYRLHPNDEALISLLHSGLQALQAERFEEANKYITRFQRDQYNLFIDEMYENCRYTSSQIVLLAKRMQTLARCRGVLSPPYKDVELQLLATELENYSRMSNPDVSRVKSTLKNLLGIPEKFPINIRFTETGSAVRISPDAINEKCQSQFGDIHIHIDINGTKRNIVYSVENQEISFMRKTFSPSEFKSFWNKIGERTDVLVGDKYIHTFFDSPLGVVLIVVENDWTSDKESTQLYINNELISIDTIKSICGVFTIQGIYKEKKFRIEKMKGPACRDINYKLTLQ